MHNDQCSNTRRQKRCAKRSGKEVKIQEFNSLLYYAFVTQHMRAVELMKLISYVV